jgi:hypothetical protein
VPEQDRGGDGDTERSGGADGEGQVQALGERLAGGGQQRLAGPTRELAGRRQGTAKGVPRGRRGLGSDPSGDGVAELAAVDDGGDAAQDGDAQRPAELGAGLEERRGRPRPLRWAAPTARSAARVSTGASAREKMTDPATRTANPAAWSLPSWVSRPKPTAASASPPAITSPGRTRRPSSGVSIDPTTNPAEAGSIHRPAASGDSPSTSCRYCATNSNVPNPTKKLSTLVVSAALKAGTRNSRRSSSGSASVCWRRTNATPTAKPATIHRAGGQPAPSWASCLSP